MIKVKILGSEMLQYREDIKSLKRYIKNRLESAGIPFSDFNSIIPKYDNGRFEFIAAESMQLATDVIVNIAKLNAAR